MKLYKKSYSIHRVLIEFLIKINLFASKNTPNDKLLVMF